MVRARWKGSRHVIWYREASVPQTARTPPAPVFPWPALTPAPIPRLAATANGGHVRKEAMRSDPLECERERKPQKGKQNSKAHGVAY